MVLHGHQQMPLHCLDDSHSNLHFEIQLRCDTRRDFPFENPQIRLSRQSAKIPDRSENGFVS